MDELRRREPEPRPGRTIDSVVDATVCMDRRDDRSAVTVALGAIVLTLVSIAIAGCSSNPEPTSFINPRFNFGFVERIAVLPFENLSADRQAGARATRLMVTELLATGAAEVVEPGEVQAALDALGPRIVRPSTEQVVALGESLDVQAVILGTVNQSESIRSGSRSIPVVSLDVHMVETETGAAVWASAATTRSGGLGARILGTVGEPISETTRRAVRRILDTLIEE